MIDYEQDPETLRMAITLLRREVRSLRWYRDHGTYDGAPLFDREAETFSNLLSDNPDFDAKGVLVRGLKSIMARQIAEGGFDPPDVKP